MTETSLQHASTETDKELRAIAETLAKENLSRLSLPEVDAAVKLVSQVVPAGNVPGMILSALTRMQGRKPAARQDVNALFKDMEGMLDKAVFNAVFAAPARVIYAYQNILRLAGKQVDESFPEGAWQFYVDYALREDTARHANETHGFDTLLNANNIKLNPVDRITAWVMAALTCLHSVPALLTNEWRERMTISLLQQVMRVRGASSKYERLYREWETRRPYRRDVDGASLDYPAYRRKKFDEFFALALQTLPESSLRSWTTRLQAAEETDLPAYLRQMTLLAYLEPGEFGETRVPFPIQQANIGIIYQGQYYLLPACDKNGNMPDVLTVRAQIAMLTKSMPTEENPTPTRLDSLARVQRAALPALRLKLDPKLVAELDHLRYAPILLNTDPRPRAQPLAEIRRAERGIGDHPLTIFDTGETFVFDQSHIFFDGAWGAALAEIMTNEALSWANYLRSLPAPSQQGERLWSRVHIQINAADMDMIQKAPHVIYEADAETNKVNIKACQNLRKIFKQRNDLLALTVNDLLVLYRAIHARAYQPSEAVLVELDRLAAAHPEVAATIRAALEEARKVNPAILIPVDASQRVPRDRVYPLNVEVPLAELDLLDLHARAIRSLDGYETGPSGNRKQEYVEFDKVQRTYLASLAGFGAYLKRAREIAIQGQSASVGAIKLLAHLPPVLQRMLDKVPERFQLLNNLIKGREVFSNVGQVASNSTLTRFLTAKDDNEQKRLAWGVMTDAKGTMAVSLRDFRPHVALLHSIGRRDLADLLAQDYLDSYANGFNAFIRDLYRITERSRETKSTIGKLIKIK